VLAVFDGANGLQYWTQDAAAPLPPAPVVENSDNVATFQIFSLGNGASVTIEELVGTIQFQGHLAVARVEKLGAVPAPTAARTVADAGVTKEVSPTIHEPSIQAIGDELKNAGKSVWDSFTGFFKGTEYAIIAIAVIAVVVLLIYFIPAAPVRRALNPAE
jgi:hypothetical protein